MTTTNHGAKVEKWRKLTDTPLTIIAIGSLPVLFLHFVSDRLRAVHVLPIPYAMHEQMVRPNVQDANVLRFLSFQRLELRKTSDVASRCSSRVNQNPER